ncbi:MAG TPA: ABC transporter ATP-binding protein [Acidobacteriaceae bacterium]|nr:ABC transporter ATP-binding protein [Acidobacteriaceae bacterium]
MTYTPVIETVALSKSYDRVQALRSLDLSVKPHRITAFLGPNGAGKSTTIRILLGIVRPTKGKGFLLGQPVDQGESVRLRARIAYVSDNKQLYDYMTVEQMIRFSRSFYTDWRPDIERTLLKTYELPIKRRIAVLSKGMRTKLALLLAFARNPELMILDEPSDGLDPVGVEQMLESLVARSAEGITIFFSSHQISEVERIADHVCLLNRGVLALDLSMDKIRESYRRIDLVFPATPDESDFRIAGVESIRTSGRQLSLMVSRNADTLIDRARKLEASSIQVSPASLRDVFLETVKEA